MALTNTGAPFSHYHTVRRGSQYITKTVQMAGNDIQAFKDFIDDSAINSADGNTSEKMCIGVGAKIAKEDPASPESATLAVLAPENTKNAFFTVKVAEGAGSNLDGRTIVVQARGSHEDVTSTTIIAAMTAFDSNLSSSNCTIKGPNIKPHSSQ